MKNTLKRIEFLEKKCLEVNEKIQKAVEGNLEVNKVIRESLKTIAEQGMFSRLLTINQAAAFLSCSRRTIYKLITDKKIRVVKVMSDKRLDRKDLEKFIQKNKK